MRSATPFRSIVLAATVIISVVSCKKDKDDPAPATQRPVTTEKVVTRTVTDLFSGALNTTTYTYFNLRTGREVPADSLTAGNWDLSFKRVEIRINSGISGSGNAGVVVAEEDINNFDNEKYAPETGYKKDGEGDEDESGLGGVKGLVFNNWYNYEQSVQPKPDRIYFIRTADNYYAKLIIKSYYRSDDPTKGGYYTFTYTYQPGGSKDFSVK